ncbi:MAG TPA: MlaD family protein [Thermoleophilaceae bacterium]|nr:MlaD family protein [Thermoleophilaceae bacterium]
MRRLLSAFLVVLVVGAAAVLAGAKDDGSKSKTVRIVFDNAFGLTEGGDFRVGGVKAGKTTKFSATDDSPPKAVVTAEISEPGFGDFRSDAACSIKPQSLIGEYYVDCQPGKSSEKLKEGAKVPVEQTTSTIPTDLINNVLRRPYRERLRMIITELGTGLAGRPDDLQEVLKRAHPGLRETSKTLRILGNQNRVIENFIKDSDTVVAQLEKRKREVTRWIEEAGRTAEISASRRTELRETFKKLPGFLAELRPTMASLEGLADEQIPLLADAQAAAPDLDRFLTKLGPFSEASRPAIRSLGKTSDVGRRAFERGADEVAELRRLAADAPGTARPLRQLLESLDDRRRAIDENSPGEKDARGKVDAPPASDPSQNNGGRGGFTGFESLWNYFFWQTLSINGYDDLGHVLRLGLTVTKCSEYENRSPMRASGEEKAEIEAHQRDCNQWLGPHQPGINAPDPSVGGSAASIAREAGRPARKVGERRGTGQPEAGALPGQRDISKPQVTLPPGLTDLLNRVPELPGATKDKTGEARDQVPVQPGEPSADQLLDYLLAP